MTQPPRRLPPTPEERVQVVVNRVAGGSDAGSTRFARPVPGLSAANSRSIPPIKGSDGQFVPLGTTNLDDGVIPSEAVPSGATAFANGIRATPSGHQSVAVAYGTATGAYTRAGGEAGSAAYGYGAAADGEAALALGTGARVDDEFPGGVALGRDANCQAANEIKLGTELHTVAVDTPLFTTAGPASGKYLKVRCGLDYYLLPLYLMQEL